MPRKPQPEGALYVKLPATAVGKLDRAAETLGIHKKDLVAGLVAKYVDPDTQHGRSALGQLSQPRRPTVAMGAGPQLGSYSFQAYELPEVMTAEQAGQFLQLAEAAVLELARRGELPCRKLGGTWRFSRTALLEWLATAAKPRRR